jgi:aromatic ring-opening dioxygenase catalytic subunit (LigB family)
LDSKRGFDHGTYSLLAVTHPDASIPVLQVSIPADYDPDSHLRLGRLLAPLREERVLIIGSGSRYHDLSAMLASPLNLHPKKESARFDEWLRETLVDSSPKQRSEPLLNWERAPCSVHPQEDHFVPLHVAIGAAEGERAQGIYQQDDFFGKIAMSSYRFGN